MDETAAGSTVGDVMNRAVVSAYRDAMYKEIARSLARNDINTVPVVDEGHRVVGVVTASDLLGRVVHQRLMPRGHRLSHCSDTNRKRHAGTARDLMTRPAITVTAETTIVEAARIAARNRVRSLPVVDRKGALVGLITRSDLVKVFLRDDAEIETEVRGVVDVGSAADARTPAREHRAQRHDRMTAPRRVENVEDRAPVPVAGQLAQVGVDRAACDVPDDDIKCAGHEHGGGQSGCPARPGEQQCLGAVVAPKSAQHPAGAIGHEQPRGRVGSVVNLLRSARHVLGSVVGWRHRTDRKPLQATGPKTRLQPHLRRPRVRPPGRSGRSRAPRAWRRTSPCRRRAPGRPGRSARPS